MGRPRKPTAVKQLAGTLRKDRVVENEAEGTAGVPDAPAWLSSRAAEIFREACGAMANMSTLSTEWRDVLAHYSVAMEEVERATMVIEDLGATYSTPTATGGVMFRSRPEVAQRDAAMRRAQILRAELGLGPASKSKVSAAKKPIERNPFLDL